MINIYSIDSIKIHYKIVLSNDNKLLYSFAKASNNLQTYL